jgi:nitrous oxide reductase
VVSIGSFGGFLVVDTPSMRDLMPIPMPIYAAETR